MTFRKAWAHTSTPSTLLAVAANQTAKCHRPEGIPRARPVRKVSRDGPRPMGLGTGILGEAFPALALTNHVHPILRWVTWSLRCVSVQNFHCWNTSESLSRPPWWKWKILYWLSRLATTSWPLVQASSLKGHRVGEGWRRSGRF